MLKVAIGLTIAIVFGALGDIFMSRGMRENGEVIFHGLADVLKVARLVFSRPLVLLGVLSMAIYFGAYVAVLQWVDVSVANPLTALSYLIATVYAVLIMREKVGLKRGGGIVLIVLGAILVGLSS
ncbi:MAG: DMT family transporter [Armatimonadota bacterium]|nr:DMT family transporter [bacterium]